MSAENKEDTESASGEKDSTSQQDVASVSMTTVPM